MTLEHLNLDLKKYTPRLKAALEEVLSNATLFRYEFITPEQLLYSIVGQEEFMRYAIDNSIDYLAMQNELIDYNVNQDKIPDGEDCDSFLSNGFMLVISLLEKEWEDHKEEGISVLDAIDVISRLEDTKAQYLIDTYLGVDMDSWYGTLSEYYSEDELKATQEEKTALPQIHAEAYINGKKVENLSEDEMFGKMMASATRLMGALKALNVSSVHVRQSNVAPDDADDSAEEESFKAEKRKEREPWEDMVTCINETYMDKNPLVGRTEELQRTIRILCRRDKNNPLFIGEPGVGKTALIYGLARMIEEGDVPQWLKGQSIYALDMGNMIAGASLHGEFERRIKMILEGAHKRGNCILYIDEIHTIMGNGNSGSSMNASDLMKPYLEDGTVRFIGSTTYQDFNKNMANNKAITRRFGQIDIKEPTVEETIEILHQLKPIYERHHGVKYTDDAIRCAVEQTSNLISDRFQPDKAIDVMDESGALLQQHPLLNKKGEPKASRYQKVDKALVMRVLTDVCRIDAKALASQDNTALEGLDQRISAEIYGQDEAVKKVVQSVMMSKAGLTDSDKPIASLLFVGPTGVGKTEVCKVLAQELGVELVRFDMSEYTEKHTVSKLIGSPAGYVGYEEGGLMTDAVRKTPNCVLLLDEIEKAHSDIYNILLQVMDYARLTDNKGNKVDFKNVILVMTSNAGAQYAGQAAIGFAGGQSKGDAMMNTVKKTFKPEFLNRLSGTVVFNDMNKGMAALILDKKLRQLSTRLKAKEVTLQLSDDAHDFLLQKGFTQQYGARELDRALQQYLTPLLMQEILFGSLRKGGEARVDVEGDTLMLKA